jgi:hypothetical protein
MPFEWQDTLAGIVGSLMCVYVGQPFDVVKTRMQTRPALYRGMANCFGATVQADGVTALWRGALPAAASAVIENAVVFTVNGMGKRVWSSLSGVPVDELSVFSCLAIGAMCGVVSSTAICPAEVRL